MPRYFFPVHDDLEVEDKEGAELPNLEAARQRAVLGARALMAEQIQQGRLNLSHSVEVSDEAGQVLLTISFREAVAIEG